jgi:ABC-type bacteriocin/lantibiotic exporter with double-glycine peptidase domain
LKAAGAEQYSVEHWQSLLRDARKLGLRGERLSLGTDVIDSALGQIQIQAIWIWGGYHVMYGALQLGEVMAFALMSALFHASVSHIGKVIITLRAALPHLRETDDLLKQPSQRHVSPTRVTQLPPGVRIRNLWFRYDLEDQQRAWVFTDFKLDLTPGEICVLDAPSGFGKTTLLKLIAGLYLPTKGTIAIAGRSPAEMREQLIYLPQFVQLFNASVLDNLRIFSGDTSRTKLLHAAEMTGLHRLMLELPMGYDTLLSQGGKNISGGQRQLIALTAVLASSKPLLLLDEAAANLDAVQWSAIKSSPLFTGKTVLCVSHSVAQNTSVRL